MLPLYAARVKGNLVHLEKFQASLKCSIITVMDTAATMATTMTNVAKSRGSMLTITVTVIITAAITIFTNTVVITIISVITTISQRVKFTS